MCVRELLFSLWKHMKPAKCPRVAPQLPHILPVHIGLAESYHRSSSVKHYFWSRFMRPGRARLIRNSPRLWNDFVSESCPMWTMVIWNTWQPNNPTGRRVLAGWGPFYAPYHRIAFHAIKLCLLHTVEGSTFRQSSAQSAWLCWYRQCYYVEGYVQWLGQHGREHVWVHCYCALILRVLTLFTNEVGSRPYETKFACWIHTAQSYCRTPGYKSTLMCNSTALGWIKSLRSHQESSKLQTSKTLCQTDLNLGIWILSFK